jgi:hypothetical protein
VRRNRLRRQRHHLQRRWFAPCVLRPHRERIHPRRRREGIVPGRAVTDADARQLQPAAVFAGRQACVLRRFKSPGRIEMLERSSSWTTNRVRRPAIKPCSRCSAPMSRAGVQRGQSWRANRRGIGPTLLGRGRQRSPVQRVRSGLHRGQQTPHQSESRAPSIVTVPEGVSTGSKTGDATTGRMRTTIGAAPAGSRWAGVRQPKKPGDPSVLFLDGKDVPDTLSFSPDGSRYAFVASHCLHRHPPGSQRDACGSVENDRVPKRFHAAPRTASSNLSHTPIWFQLANVWLTNTTQRIVGRRLTSGCGMPVQSA